MGIVSPLPTTHSDAQQVSPTDDWTGPDDPDCPYNWPMWKRIYMTSIPAFLCINVLVCPFQLKSRFRLILIQVIRLVRLHTWGEQHIREVRSLPHSISARALSLSLGSWAWSYHRSTCQRVLRS